MNNPKLKYIGILLLENDQDYFITNSHSYQRIFQRKYPYKRADIIKEAVKARKEGNLALSGMLESLIQLRFSWMPQIIERFLKPDPKGLYTPHRCKLKTDE